MKSTVGKFAREVGSKFVRLIFWVAIVFGCLDTTAKVEAAITTTGDVAPAPPSGGGSVSGPFRVGNTAFGSMSIAGGTALTSSSDAFIGDAAAGIGSVTMSGFGSDWTLTTAGADLRIGNSGTGSITVSSTAKMTVPDFTIIGSLAGSAGSMTVSGLGTLWSNGGVMSIGTSGRGTANITSGGRLNSADATLGSSATGEGTVSISGQFSLWQVTGDATVGSFGRGTLLIDNGGRLTTSASSDIGSNSGSVGDLEVSGAGSEWTDTGSLNVGSSGAGTVKVLNGGRIATTGAVVLALNSSARGDVIVDGDGSVWNITGQIDTSVGPAHVTVSNGGLITNTSGPFWGAAGQLTLAGGGRFQTSAAGGMTNSGLISGSGMLDSPVLNNGGRLQTASGDKLVLTGTLSNTGLVDLAGGELDVTGATTNSHDIDARDAIIRFGGTGLSNNSAGALAITAGTVDVYGAVNNKAGAQIVLGQGAHAVFHDAVTNGGQLFVPPGGNVLMLESLSLGASSSLNLQTVGTVTDTGLGRVDVAGTASLFGTLTVGLASGYAPKSGDSFQVLDSVAGVSGTFSTLMLPSLTAGLVWNVNYASNSVTLSVTPGLPGDYNQNGIVDGADYVVWRKNNGSNNMLPNDPIGGTIGQAQYNNWRAHFGQTAGSGSGASVSAAVPEPATVLQLILLTAVVTIRRRIAT